MDYSEYEEHKEMDEEVKHIIESQISFMKDHPEIMLEMRKIFTELEKKPTHHHMNIHHYVKRAATNGILCR